MKKMIIYDYRNDKDEHHSLSVEIKENGDLVFSGYDSGPSVKEHFGDFDYEYWVTVKSEYVFDILLNLIKDYFKSNSKIKEWLKTKEIPFETFSF